MENFYLKANYCLSFSLVQNYALKVKVINSFSAESAEFLSCRDGELITLIAKDCHRYDTVIVCFSAFSLLLVADRLAFKLLACGLIFPRIQFLAKSCYLWYFIFGTPKYVQYVTNSRRMFGEHGK